MLIIITGSDSFSSGSALYFRITSLVVINPESIEEYSISRLPISFIVCSYSEMMQSKTALAVCPKVKPVLEKNGTLLILRGIDAMDEIPQLNLFGFDGYAVNKTQSD